MSVQHFLDDWRFLLQCNGPNIVKQKCCPDVDLRCKRASLKHFLASSQRPTQGALQ